jgi:hypothetical protein
MLDDLRNKHAVMPMKRPGYRFAAVASQQSIRSNTGIVDTREHKAGRMKQKVASGGSAFHRPKR